MWLSLAIQRGPALAWFLNPDPSSTLNRFERHHHPYGELERANERCSAEVVRSNTEVLSPHRRVVLSQRPFLDFAEQGDFRFPRSLWFGTYSYLWFYLRFGSQRRWLGD